MYACYNFILLINIALRCDTKVENHVFLNHLSTSPEAASVFTKQISAAKMGESFIPLLLGQLQYSAQEYKIIKIGCIYHLWSQTKPNLFSLPLEIFLNL